MEQYCPDCVVELRKESKHPLGKHSVWYVCPKCGYRERPCLESVTEDITQSFTRRLKHRNKNINQFNRDV